MTKKVLFEELSWMNVEEYLKTDDRLVITMGACENGIEIEVKITAGAITTKDFLIRKLGPYEDPKEDPEIAYCAECEYPEPSVIPIGEYEEKGLCLNCNTLHDHKSQCHYCGEFVAGMDLEASYSSGCIFCTGSFGADDS